MLGLTPPFSTWPHWWNRVTTVVWYSTLHPLHTLFFLCFSLDQTCLIKPCHSLLHNKPMIAGGELCKISFFFLLLLCGYSLKHSSTSATEINTNSVAQRVLSSFLILVKVTSDCIALFSWVCFAYINWNQETPHLTAAQQSALGNLSAEPLAARLMLWLVGCKVA